MDITKLNLNQITLELFKRRIQSCVSDSFLMRMEHKEYTDVIFQETIHALEFEIFGIKRTIKREITRPFDWWEAVKERFFPNWLLKKFPVKFETIPIDIEVYKVCPHLNRAAEFDHINFFVQDGFKESDWKEDKSVPQYLKETIMYLETAANMLSNTHQLFVHDLIEQVKKLKEII